MGMLSLDKVFLIAVIAMLTFVCSHSDASRAGIVGAGLPGEDPALVNALTAQLNKAGYAITGVDADILCDSAKLNSLGLDLLVLPNAADLPAKSVQAIGDFARAGGDIIALNAPLWQRMLVNVDGKWTTQEAYQHSSAGNLPEHVLFDFSNTTGWKRTSDKIESPTTYETVADGPAAGQHALHGLITNLTGWDNFGIRDLDKPFPQGHTLTVFSAKGEENTTHLSVEWAEKDGSRWIAVVPLGKEWRQYVLKPSDFVYWTSTEGRGGRGDSFKPQNAATLSFGLAFSHTGWEEGRHEFWVGPVGTAESMTDLGSVLGPFDLPAMDTLCPSYKLFDSHGVSSLSIRPDQVMVPDVMRNSIQHPGQILNQVQDDGKTALIRSPQPRPSGAGFDKRRNWRWIPIMEARAANKQWRGDPVTMMINADGKYKGGVWTSFGFSDAAVYKQPQTLAIIGRIAERMRNQVYILDGGANFYTYFDGQDVQLGMRVCNLGKEARSGLSARVIVIADQQNKPPAAQHWEFGIQPGAIKTLSGTWRPTRWPAGGYTVLAELLENGKVIDSVTHRINVWRPKKTKHYITVKDGQFMLRGKLWRANGVNYMPSSGIGAEDGEYFEHWISAGSYDPEIVDRDLDHMQEMGINALSIFIYSGVEKDQNLLDILRRMRARGMHANVGLRPGMPQWWDWSKIRQIIEKMRLAENDTVFAYDIAWEPMFNTHNDRKIYDKDWEKWIIERYGSIAAAEKDWGFAVPRDPDGTVTNPNPEQVDTDGPWLKMTAAYRKFLDTLLYKQYSVPRREIRSIDPNHFVSFRMAEAANPTYRWDGRIPYDFPYLAGAVDVLEPEAYGRIGDWEGHVKPGWFEVAYAKWAAPEKPMLWAEMGCSTWDLTRMQDSQQKMDYQAMFHEAFYKMLISSGANGIFFWWYPGGFRYGENSDFGIINPDGTDKPVTKVIRENSRKFLDAPIPKKPDYWIEIDRDLHPVGVAGIYDDAKDRFWAAIAKGQTPGLRTAGTGTDSSNAAPKYLEAVFDSIQLLGADGKWIEVPKDGSVKASLASPVMARAEFTNLGEAKLLKQSSNGAVQLAIYLSDKRAGAQPIAEDVAHLRSATADAFKLLDAKPTEPTKVTITFSNGSVEFGERFSFTLEP